MGGRRQRREMQGKGKERGAERGCNKISQPLERWRLNCLPPFVAGPDYA